MSTTETQIPSKSNYFGHKAVQFLGKIPLVKPFGNFIYKISNKTAFHLSIITLALVLFFTYIPNLGQVILVLAFVFLLTAGVYAAFNIILKATRSDFWSKSWQKLLAQFPIKDKNTYLLFSICAVFYIGLIIVVVFTGWLIKNEWAILVIAAMPLIVYMILQLLPYLQSARIAELEFGIFKLKLDTSAVASTFHTERLYDWQSETVTKGAVKDIDAIIRETRQRNSNPRVLLIPLITSNTRDTIEYVNAFSREFSTLRYLVFIDNETNKYRGFMKIEDFISRYPLPNFANLFGLDTNIIHRLIDPLQGSNSQSVFTFSNLVNEVIQTINVPYIRKDVIQAIQESRRARFTENSMKAMKADIKPLKEPSLIEAYKKLNDAGSGLPVVDKDDHFIGVVEYQDIVSQLLTQTKSTQGATA